MLSLLKTRSLSQLLQINLYFTLKGSFWRVRNKMASDGDNETHCCQHRHLAPPQPGRFIWKIRYVLLLASIIIECSSAVIPWFRNSVRKASKAPKTQTKYILGLNKDVFIFYIIYIYIWFFHVPLYTYWDWFMSYIIGSSMLLKIKKSFFRNLSNKKNK